MIKRSKMILSFLLLVLTTVVLIACGSDTLYTVSFDTDGGSPTPPDQLVLRGELAIEPTSPSKGGYTFSGWYLEDIVFDFDTPITADITLVASWTEVIPQTFIVTFNSNGGSTVASQSINQGQLATEPTAPTRTGYTFNGWFIEDSIFDFDTPITADITLVASWTEVIPQTFIVTFNSNGGSTVASQSINQGQLATEPTAPTRTGYTFNGWFVNDIAFNFNTPITANITLVASWTEITPQTFIVTFNSNGGFSIDSQTILEGQLATEPTEPTKDGFIFTGWYLDGSIFDFNTPVISDLTLIAGWDEIIINSYVVSFNSSGGSTVLSQTVLEGQLATEPTEPTKDGFIFTGWYLDGSIFDFNTPITTDVTLNATWEEDLSPQLDAALNISIGFSGTPEEAQAVFEENAISFGIDLSVYNSLSAEDKTSGIILLQQQLTPYLPYVDQYIAEANKTELDAFALFITNTITVWQNLETARKTSETLLDENSLLNINITQDDITLATEQLELALSFSGTSWHELFLIDLINTLSLPVAQTIDEAQQQLDTLTPIRLAATFIADAILTSDPELLVDVITNHGSSFGIDLTNFLLLSYQNQVRAASILITNLEPYNEYLYDYIEQTNNLDEINEFSLFISDAVDWFIVVLNLEDTLTTIFDLDGTTYPEVTIELIDDAILLADQILDYSGVTWHQKQLEQFLTSLVTPYKTQLLNAQTFLVEKQEILDFNNYLINHDTLDITTALPSFSENINFSLQDYNQISPAAQDDLINLLKTIIADNYSAINTLVSSSTTSNQLQSYKDFLELLFEKYLLETTIHASLDNIVVEGTLAVHKDQHDIEQLSGQVLVLLEVNLTLDFEQILYDSYLLASATNINSQLQSSLLLADLKTIYVNDEAQLRSANSQTDKIIILTDNIDLTTKFEVNNKNTITAQFDEVNNRYYAITFLHNSTANAYGNNNTIMLSKNDVALKRLTIISYVLYNANIIQWYGTTNGYIEDVTIINQTTSNSNAGIQITSKSSSGGNVIFAEVTVNRLHTVNTRWAGVVVEHNGILNVIGLGSHKFLTTVNSQEYDRVDFRNNAGGIDSSYPAGSQKGVINIIGNLGYIQNQASGGVAYFSLATLNFAAEHIISNSILNIVKKYFDTITSDLIFITSFTTSNSVYIDRPIRIHNSHLAPNVSFIIGSSEVYFDDSETPAPITTTLTATTLTQLKEYVNYDFVNTINYTASSQTNAGYYEINITRDTPLTINLTNPQPFLFNFSSMVNVVYNEEPVLNSTILSISSSTNISLLINNNALVSLTSTSSVTTPETILTRVTDLTLTVPNENVLNGRLAFYEGDVKHTLVINSTESNLSEFTLKYYQLFGVVIIISFTSPLYS